MRYGTSSFPGFKTAIETIFNRGFENYISPYKYDKMASKGYIFLEWKSGPSANHTRAKIKEILLRGNFVTCGYMATSIKNYHDYYIIYKP
jgi:hypothetical protein